MNATEIPEQLPPEETGRVRQYMGYGEPEG